MGKVITDDEARTNLAENLSTILEFRGLTQTSLAQAVNRPVMTVNHAVNGTRRPGAALVQNFGEATGYSSKELLGPPGAIRAQEKLRASEKRNREKSLVPA
jgi:transcriptional regulator with XRE-family HTH domain